MKIKSNIDIQESIKNEELICELSFNKKLERLLSILFFVFGIYILVSIFRKENQPINEFLKYTIPILVLFLCYCIYRKFVEYNLITIITNLNKKSNENILLDFIKSKNYKSEFKTKDLIILSENGYLITENIETIFIISDNKIFFTILKQGFRIDAPTLFSHIKLKKELIAHFKNNNKLN